MKFKSLASQDLDHVVLAAGSAWEQLRGAKIFLTGGTGFFGGWLVESLLHANAKLDLNARITVLTRDLADGQRRLAAVAGAESVRFHEGDVRGFEFPGGDFTHVIHAATDAGAKLNAENPALMADTIVDGTKRVLEFAQAVGVKQLLFTSSGAIYGRQPPEVERFDEDFVGGPNPSNALSAYAEAKRYAELLCAIATRSSRAGLEAKIARCFAFVGPRLPLDERFAVGNFIGDAMAGRPIRILGDGTPRRSYLYAADLAAWLWTILVQGKPGRSYNVGSEVDYSIREVAEKVAAQFALRGRKVSVEVAKQPISGRPAERYVPSTARAREELSLGEKIGLDEGIRRMIEWSL